jgi:predicted enzyme related to lactoylglutathione lyase
VREPGGAEAVGGIMTKPETVPAPHWGFYFNVEAIDAGAARVKEHGGKILNGPMQVPGGGFIVHRHPRAHRAAPAGDSIRLQPVSADT